jgi:hypothetical protein
MPLRHRCKKASLFDHSRKSFRAKLFRRLRHFDRFEDAQKSRSSHNIQKGHHA